jgi:His/Glu/Gln/Arg/opine family amino acid ABC transporter permease subunit
MTRIAAYLPLLLDGLRLTLGLTAAAMILGSLIGFLVMLVRTSRWKPVRILASLYIDFFRTTPFLVQILWVFFVLPVIIGRQIDENTAGIISLSLNTSAFMAEIFRSGIEAVGRPQWDAGAMLGMSRRQILQFVIMPQAIRIVLPAISTITILVLKSTSYLAIIGVLELTYRATLITQIKGHYIETFSVAALFYIVAILILSAVSSLVERRLGAGAGTLA